MGRNTEVGRSSAFGAFAAVWEDLGSMDSHISDLRSPSRRRNAIFHISEEERGMLDASLRRKLDIRPQLRPEETDEGELWLDAHATLDENECESEASPCSSAAGEKFRWPTSYAECNTKRAETGPFSNVWSQLNSLNAVLNDSSSSSNSPLKGACLSEAPLDQDEPSSGRITVVTMGGEIVDNYELTPGMSVRALRDKVAASRGEPPFTVTLLFGADVLDNCMDCDELVRQSENGVAVITVLRSAPNVGHGSFSKVWDSLGSLGMSLGSLEVAREVEAY